MVLKGCKTVGCGNSVPVHQGRGRPAVYCSSCAAARSKAAAKNYIKNAYSSTTRRAVSDSLKYEFIKSLGVVSTKGVSFLNQKIQYNGSSIDISRIEFPYKKSVARLPPVGPSKPNQHIRDCFCDYMDRRVLKWAFALKNNDVSEMQNILADLHSIFDGKIDMEFTDSVSMHRISL